MAEPTSSYGFEYVSIVSFISQSGIGKHMQDYCVFERIGEKNPFGRFSEVENLEMMPTGRAYLYRLAALENYIRWRSFKQEQIQLLKERSQQFAMLQVSILQGVARSMNQFVELAHRIDRSAEEGSRRLVNKALAWSRLLTLGTASPDASDFASLTEAASMVAYLSGPYMQASANKCGLARAIEMRQRQVLGKGAPKSSLLGVLDPIDRSTRQCLEQDRQRLYGFFSSRFLENDVQTRALKSLHGTLWSASCAMCTELVMYVSNPESKRQTETSGEFKTRQTAVAAFCATRGSAFARANCIAVSGDLLHSLISGAGRGDHRRTFTAATSGDIDNGADLSDAVRAVHLARSDGSPMSALTTPQGRLAHAQFVCWRQMSCLIRSPSDFSTFKQHKRSQDTAKGEKTRTETRDLLRELSREPSQMDTSKVRALASDLNRDNTEGACKKFIDLKDALDEQTQRVESSKQLQKCVVCQKLVGMARLQASIQGKKGAHVGKLSGDAPLVRAVCAEDEFDEKAWDIVADSGCGENPFSSMKDMSGQRDPSLQERRRRRRRRRRLLEQAKTSPIQLAMLLSGDNPAGEGGSSLGVAPAVASLVSSIKTAELGAKQMPLQCGGALVPRSTLAAANAYSRCLAEKTRGSSAAKIGRQDCVSETTRIDAELTSRILALSSTLGLPDTAAREGQNGFKDRISTYVLARTRSYVGEYPHSEVSDPQALGAVPYKLGTGASINSQSICVDVHACTLEHVKIAKHYFAIQAESPPSPTTKDEQESDEKVPVLTPGRGGVDTSAMKKEEDTTINAVEKLHLLHGGGGSGSTSSGSGSSNKAEAEGKTLFLELGSTLVVHSPEMSKQGTTRDMEALERWLLYDEKSSAASQPVSFLETLNMAIPQTSADGGVAELGTTESLYLSKVKQYLDLAWDKAGKKAGNKGSNRRGASEYMTEENEHLDRMIDGDRPVLEMPLANDDSAANREARRRYAGDLVKLSTQHWREEYTRLQYENERLRTATQHARRIATQAREEQIRIGKPVLPGTMNLGQGIDILTGDTKRPLLRVNLAGPVKADIGGELAQKYIIGGALSVEMDHTVRSQQLRISYTLEDLRREEALRHGMDPSTSGIFTLSPHVLRFSRAIAKNTVLVQRRVVFQMYTARLQLSNFLERGTIGKGTGNRMDALVNPDRVATAGPVTSFGADSAPFVKGMNTRTLYAEEPSPSAPLRRDYSERAAVMRYVNPVGAPALRKDICAGGVGNILGSATPGRTILFADGRKEEIPSGDQQGDGTGGESVLALDDCILSPYHLLNDLDAGGEVNLEGVFLDRDKGEREASIEAGEDVAPCSPASIKTAIQVVNRYGTHFTSGITMGCEVNQMFRINKDDLFSNLHLHPDDYIEKILSRSMEDQDSSVRGQDSDVTSQIKSEHGGVFDEPVDWWDNEDVVEMPSRLHKAMTPRTVKSVRKRFSAPPADDSSLGGSDDHGDGGAGTDENEQVSEKRGPDDSAASVAAVGPAKVKDDPRYAPFFKKLKTVRGSTIRMNKLRLEMGLIGLDPDALDDPDGPVPVKMRRRLRRLLGVDSLHHNESASSENDDDLGESDAEAEGEVRLGETPWRMTIEQQWIESNGGRVSLLPRKIKDLARTDLAPWLDSCTDRPAIVAQNLEPLTTVILGDQETLEECVMNKRYIDAYKMVCVKDCEAEKGIGGVSAAASPKEIARFALQNAPGRDAYDDGMPRDKECHSGSSMQNKCVGEVAMLAKNLPTPCGNWYHPTMSESDLKGAPTNMFPKFDPDQCMQCAKMCSEDSSVSPLCKDEVAPICKCRWVGCGGMNFNAIPGFDYVRNARRLVAMHHAARKLAEQEPTLRTKLMGSYRASKNEKLKQGDLSADPYGRMLLRKVRSFENTANFLRLKSEGISATQVRTFLVLPVQTFSAALSNLDLPYCIFSSSFPARHPIPPTQ